MRWTNGGKAGVLQDLQQNSTPKKGRANKSGEINVV
jgi:hypothetical protein